MRCFPWLLISVPLVILLATPGFSQTDKIGSLETTSDIVYATVDRPGELYVISGNGTIEKISTQGELLYTFNGETRPSLFDPRDGARIFAYYGDRQEYVFLTPELTVASTNPVDQAHAINPYLVCPAGDFHLVILDTADWSLRKINTKTSSVVWESGIKKSLKENSHITYIREYQSFIFLLDNAQGILIFNSLGRFIRSIPIKDLSYFNFLGEELYYLQNNKIHFFDLFTASTRETDFPSPCDFVLLTDERIFMVRGNSIEIFKP